MLKPVALANSFAASTLIFYLFLFVLKIVARPFYNLLLNSQFFGADFASQTPAINIPNAAGILIAVATVAWVFGYLVGHFYNLLGKKS